MQTAAFCVVLAMACAVACAQSLSYHSHAELLDVINEVTTTECPQIATSFTAGTSVQGRALAGVKFWGAADLEAPEVKVIGNMHGDETVGREMLIQLILHLCSQYYVDSDIRWLVDHTQLFLLPSMNPDGYELGPQRANANGYDLNRNFPDQFVDITATRQPETTAIMDWSRGRTFALACNLHGGDLVASYPWDGLASGSNTAAFSEAPDNDLYASLAATYADTHLTMHTDSSFPGGVTNAADWYPLYGGMQDWDIVHLGTPHITLELSMVKNPPASTLITEWNNNRPALLAYAHRVHQSARGRITTESGDPVIGATCAVKGREDNGALVSRVSPVNGMWYRALEPGTWTIVCTVPDHDAVEHNVVVEAGHVQGTAARFDLVVTPDGIEGGEPAAPPSPPPAPYHSGSDRGRSEMMIAIVVSIFLLLGIGAVGFAWYARRQRSSPLRHPVRLLDVERDGKTSGDSDSLASPRSSPDSFSSSGPLYSSS